MPLVFDEACRTGSRVFPELGESAKLELLAFAADHAEELKGLHGKGHGTPSLESSWSSTRRAS